MDIEKILIYLPNKKIELKLQSGTLIEEIKASIEELSTTFYQIALTAENLLNAAKS